MAIHTVLVVTCATLKRQRLVSLGFTLAYFILRTTVGTRTHESQYYLRLAGVNSFRQFSGRIDNRSRHNAERLAGEYTWIWIGISVSTITYCVLFYLVDRQIRWAKFELQGRGHMQVEGKMRRSINIIVYVRSDFSESPYRLTFFLH
jgi:hypothetical protein